MDLAMNNTKAIELIKGGNEELLIFKCDSKPESKIFLLKNKKTGKISYPTTNGSNQIHEKYICLTADGDFIYQSSHADIKRSPLQTYLNQLIGIKKVDEFHRISDTLGIPSDLRKVLLKLLGI